MNAATPKSATPKRTSRALKLLLFFLVVPMLTAPIFTPSPPTFAASQNFIDVPATHWASSFIEPLAQTGIIGGYPDSTFKPSANVKIGEFIAMTVKALGYRFEPLSSDWAKPYIDKAIELKIIQDKEFPSYTALINREQMTSIVMHAIALNEIMPNATFDQYIKNETKDYHLVGDAYKQAVIDSYKLGIITGYDDKTFKPKDFSTRAQASAVILKILNKDIRKPFEKSDIRYTMVPTIDLDEFGNKIEYNIALYAPLLNGKPVNEMIEVAEIMVKNIHHGKGFIGVGYNQYEKMIGSAGYESKAINDWMASLSPYEFTRNVTSYADVNYSVDFNNFNDKYNPYKIYFDKRPSVLEVHSSYSSYYLATYGDQLRPLFQYWFGNDYNTAWNLMITGLDYKGASKHDLYTLNGRTLSIVYSSNGCYFAFSLKK